MPSPFDVAAFDARNFEINDDEPPIDRRAHQDRRHFVYGRKPSSSAAPMARDADPKSTAGAGRIFKSAFGQRGEKTHPSRSAGNTFGPDMSWGLADRPKAEVADRRATGTSSTRTLGSRVAGMPPIAKKPLSQQPIASTSASRLNDGESAGYDAGRRSNAKGKGRADGVLIKGMGRPKPSPTPVSLSDDDDSIEDSDLEINEEEVVKASRGRGTTQLLDTPSFQRGMARANDSVDELAILGSMGRSSTAAGHVRHTVAGIEARGQSALEAKPNRIGAMKGKMGAAGPAAPNRTVSKRTQDEVNPLAEPWRTIELPVAELFIGLQPYPLGSSRWKCMLDNKCISLIKDERPTLQVHLEKLKDIEHSGRDCESFVRIMVRPEGIVHITRDDPVSRALQSACAESESLDFTFICPAVTDKAPNSVLDFGSQVKRLANVKGSVISVAGRQAVLKDWRALPSHEVTGLGQRGRKLSTVQRDGTSSDEPAPKQLRLKPRPSAATPTPSIGNVSKRPARAAANVAKKNLEPQMPIDLDGDGDEDEEGRGGADHPASTGSRKSARVQAQLEPVLAPTRPPPEELMVVYPHEGVGAVSITQGDFARLDEGEFLNDTLIEFGLKRIFHDLDVDFRKDVHIFNSFFYKKLTQKEKVPPGQKANKAGSRSISYDSVKKWTSKFDLFSKKYIVIPINEHLHWYLAVICNPGAILHEVTPAVKTFMESKSTKTKGLLKPSRKSARQSHIPALEPDEAEAAVREDLAAPPTEQTSKYFGPKPSQEDREDARDAAAIDAELKAKDAPATSGKRAVNGREPVVEGDSTLEADVTMDDGDQTLDASDDADAEGTTGAVSAKEDVAMRDESLPPAVGGDKGRAEEADNAPPKPSPPAESPTPYDVEKLVQEGCCIITFDSLGGAHHPVERNLKKFLEMEAMDKKHIPTASQTSAVWVKCSPAKAPAQPNFCDCGLYLLHFVRVFLASPDAFQHCAFTNQWFRKDRTSIPDWRLEQLEGQQQQREAWRADILRLTEQYKPLKAEKEAREAAAKEERRKRKLANSLAVDGAAPSPAAPSPAEVPSKSGSEGPPLPPDVIATEPAASMDDEKMAIDGEPAIAPTSAGIAVIVPRGSTLNPVARTPPPKAKSTSVERDAVDVDAEESSPAGKAESSRRKRRRIDQSADLASMSNVMGADPAMVSRLASEGPSWEEAVNAALLPHDDPDEAVATGGPVAVRLASNSIAPNFIPLALSPHQSRAAPNTMDVDEVASPELITKKTRKLNVDDLKYSLSQEDAASSPAPPSPPADRSPIPNLLVPGVDKDKTRAKFLAAPSAVIDLDEDEVPPPMPSGRDEPEHRMTSMTATLRVHRQGLANDVYTGLPEPSCRARTSASPPPAPASSSRGRLRSPTFGDRTSKTSRG